MLGRFSSNCGECVAQGDQLGVLKLAHQPLAEHLGPVGDGQVLEKGMVVQVHAERDQLHQHLEQAAQMLQAKDQQIQAMGQELEREKARNATTLQAAQIRAQTDLQLQDMRGGSQERISQLEAQVRLLIERMGNAADLEAIERKADAQIDVAAATSLITQQSQPLNNRL